MNKYIQLTLTLIALFPALTTNATHLRSGEIHVRQESANSLTVWITITVFTNNHNTTVLFGGDDDILDFGDGSDPDNDGKPGILVPESPNNERPDLAPWVTYATFTISHTYPSVGQYLVSYSEPNRNAGILNIDNSENTRFYTETLFTITEGQRYATPEFLTPPIFSTAFQHPLHRSMACIDSVNQLTYSLVIPKRARDSWVVNYRPPVGLTINKHNGEITWPMNKPDVMVGEYNIAIKVAQSNNGHEIGYIIRDLQIIVTEQEPTGEVMPDSTVDDNGKIFVEEGMTESSRVIATHASGSNVDITVFSELAGTEFLNVDTYDSADIYSVVKLTFVNAKEITRDVPFPVTIRAQFDEQNITDINYLFFTKDVDLTEEPSTPVITRVVVEEVGIKTLYPNPSAGHVQINASEYPATIEIRNTNGQLVKRQTIFSSDVDISDLAAGAYIFILHQKSGRSVMKAIRN